MNWQFFATLTVTAFVFLVVTTVMGIACYLNYGKGLAHYREYPLPNSIVSLRVPFEPIAD